MDAPVDDGSGASVRHAAVGLAAERAAPVVVERHLVVQVASSVEAPSAGDGAACAFGKRHDDVVAAQVGAPGDLGEGVFAAVSNAHGYEAALASIARGLAAQMPDLGAGADDHFHDAVREGGRLLDQHQLRRRFDLHQNVLESAAEAADAHRFGMALRWRMDDHAGVEQQAVDRGKRVLRQIDGSAEVPARQGSGAWRRELGHGDGGGGCDLAALGGIGRLVGKRRCVPARDVGVAPCLGAHVRQPAVRQGVAAGVAVPPGCVGVVLRGQPCAQPVGIRRRASHSPSLPAPTRASGRRSGRCALRRARGRGPAPHGSAGAGSG